MKPIYIIEIVLYVQKKNCVVTTGNFELVCWIFKFYLTVYLLISGNICEMQDYLQSDLWLKWNYLKKYAQDSGFLFGSLRHESPQPVGDFKNPSGTPPGPQASAPGSVRRFAPHFGLRSSPRARRIALGIFKIPSGHRGSRRRFPPKNPNLLFLILHE